MAQAAYRGLTNKSLVDSSDGRGCSEWLGHGSTTIVGTMTGAWALAAVGLAAAAGIALKSDDGVVGCEEAERSQTGGTGGGGGSGGLITREDSKSIMLSNKERPSKPRVDSNSDYAPRLAQRVYLHDPSVFKLESLSNFEFEAENGNAQVKSNRLLRIYVRGLAGLG